MFPLSGITILDLSRLLPGGFCSLILSDLGARVIKIEEPGVGDFYRKAAGRPLLGEAWFEALNRGKEGISLNLKDPRGRNLFLKMAKRADVVIESFRPGRLKKLGVGYEELKKVNRRIILCSITGYGQTGPYKDKGGHDLNYMGLAGILGSFAPPGGPPSIFGLQLADLVGGGIYGALAIVAALAGRGRSGEGRWIDLSMTEGVMSLAAMELATVQSTEDYRLGRMLLGGGAASYGIYRTKDNRFVGLSALEPKFWQTFSKIVGLKVSETGFDPAVFSEPLKKRLSKIFAKRTLKEWTRLSSRYDFCLVPIRKLEEVPHDPHFRARGLFRHRLSPFVFDGKRLSKKGKAPRYGGETKKVLREIGLSAEDIRKLRDEGVI